MKEYEWNHWPKGEDGVHYPVVDCPCRPTLQIRDGAEILVHRQIYGSMAIIWIAVEIELGFRCAEHRLLIDQRIPTVGGHIHRRQMKPLYEYSHAIQ